MRPLLGGNLGTVVMGGDSCTEGRGFKFSTIYWIFHINL